jgi:hypothetical protein
MTGAAKVEISGSPPARRAEIIERFFNDLPVLMSHK